jgi:hypothetical protein
MEASFKAPAEKTQPPNAGPSRRLSSRLKPRSTSSPSRPAYHPAQLCLRPCPCCICCLQRTAGNRAVSRLTHAKLTVGPVGDAYEQERTGW